MSPKFGYSLTILIFYYDVVLIVNIKQSERPAELCLYASVLI